MHRDSAASVSTPNRPPRTTRSAKKPAFGTGAGVSSSCGGRKSISAGEPAERPSSAVSSSGRTPAPRSGKSPAAEAEESENPANTTSATGKSSRSAKATRHTPVPPGRAASRPKPSVSIRQVSRWPFGRSVCWASVAPAASSSAPQTSSESASTAQKALPGALESRLGAARPMTPLSSSAGTAAQYAALSANGSSSPVPTAKICAPQATPAAQARAR